MTPAISVILLTPDRFDRLRKVIRHLRRQTIAHRLEIVIAAPSLARLDAGERELDCFHGVRLLEVGEFKSVGAPKLAAVRAAKAPIIAFGEDHCFPEPEWAESLLAAWRGNHGAVGVTMRNANPGALSWADMVLNFGPHIESTAADASAGLAWHNTTYRRDQLLEFGDSLARLITQEFLLQQEIARRGLALHRETAARVHHVNFSRMKHFAGSQFWGNRFYGFLRRTSGQWPLGRRVVYAGAFPLIALVRFGRALSHFRRLSLPVRILPALLAGAVIAAAGEAAGYLLGEGKCERRRVWFELHRAEQVRPSDRRLFEVGPLEPAEVPYTGIRRQ